MLRFRGRGGRITACVWYSVIRCRYFRHSQFQWLPAWRLLVLFPSPPPPTPHQPTPAVGQIPLTPHLPQPHPCILSTTTICDTTAATTSEPPSLARGRTRGGEHSRCAVPDLVSRDEASFVQGNDQIQLRQKRHWRYWVRVLTPVTTARLQLTPGRATVKTTGVSTPPPPHNVAHRGSSDGF